MDEKELYERKRIHDLINDNIANSGKIDMIFEKENALKEDISELKVELRHQRYKLEKINNTVVKLASYMVDLKKFFWMIVAATFSMAGIQILRMVTDAIPI